MAGEQDPLRGRSGKADGTPPTGGAESSQPHIISYDRMIRKIDLPLFHGAAEGLTQAGLGTHSYTIAEQQTNPSTGIPLGEASPFVVVTYRGQENRDKLWKVVVSVAGAKQRAVNEGKPQTEVNRIMQE